MWPTAWCPADSRSSPVRTPNGKVRTPPSQWEMMLTSSKTTRRPFCIGKRSMSDATPRSILTSRKAGPMPANGLPSTRCSTPRLHPRKSAAASTRRAKFTSSTRTASSSADRVRSTPARSSLRRYRSTTTLSDKVCSTIAMPSSSSRRSKCLAVAMVRRLLFQTRLRLVVATVML